MTDKEIDYTEIIEHIGCTLEDINSTLIDISKTLKNLDWNR